MAESKNNYFLIKQIAPFLRPYKAKVALIILFVPFIALLQGAQPYLLKRVIDQYTLHKNLDSFNLFFYPAILAVTLAFLLILRTWQNFVVQAVGQNFVADIREKLFEHLQALSIDFFERNQAGKLLTRLTSDIEALSETFSSGLVGGANDLFSLVGVVGFMLWLNWKLTLAQLVLIPVLLILTKSFEAYYRKANLDSRKELAQLNSNFQESLAGLSIIKIFNRESFLSKKFADVNEKYIKANNKSIAADSAFSAIIELVGLFGILLVVIVSVTPFANVTPGNLVAFVGYSQLLFGPIRSLSEKFSVFQAGFTSAERITSLLQEEPSIIHNASNEVWLPKNTAISFKSVSFKYKKEEENYILSDLSFNLPEGQSLGIVGRTGSGKSTLIKLLCRFYDPNKGDIFIGDQNLRSINPTELRKHILLIPQRSFLFSGTLHENLVLDKTDLPMSRIEEVAEETGLIKIVKTMKKGFQTELREGGVDLSSGQKQLVSLTRAIIQEPKILILDEATASLDNFTEELVTTAIKKILHSGKTVIYIAHRINLVTECNQIMVMHNGKIKELGTHEELINNKDYYSHLYDLSSLI